MAKANAPSYPPDEEGWLVQSEKLLEVVFSGGKPVRTGDQFGLERKRQFDASTRCFVLGDAKRNIDLSRRKRYKL
jgi:hypothetical protein